MESIHPDLKDLITNVTSLLEQYHAGAITMEDALALWGNYVAIDGEGSRWTISQNSPPPNFVFLKANPDGTGSHEENPLRFVPPTLPPEPEKFPIGGVPTPPTSPTIPQPPPAPATGAPTPPASPYHTPPSPTTIPKHSKTPRKLPKPDLSAGVLKAPLILLADFLGALKDASSGSSFFAKYKALITIVVLGGLLLGYMQFFYVPTKDTYAAKCPEVSSSVTGLDNADTKKYLGCLSYPGPGIDKVLIENSKFNGNAPLTQETFAVVTARVAEYLSLPTTNSEAELTDAQTDAVAYVNKTYVLKALRYGYVDPDFVPTDPVTAEQVNRVLLSIWNAKKLSSQLISNLGQEQNTLKEAGLSLNAKAPLKVNNEYLVQELGFVFYKINDPTFKPKTVKVALQENEAPESTPELTTAQAASITKTLISNDLTKVQSVVATPILASDNAALASLAALAEQEADVRMSPLVNQEGNQVATAEAFVKGTDTKISQAVITFTYDGKNWVIKTLPVFAA